jgi:putative component of membrane protein insertase Oxa1/YidC/SpoIIIJ protein YidD
MFGVCNSVRLLYLLVITIRKWSINPKSRRESLMHVTIGIQSKYLFVLLSAQTVVKGCVMCAERDIRCDEFGSCRTLMMM